MKRLIKKIVIPAIFLVATLASGGCGDKRAAEERATYAQVKEYYDTRFIDQNKPIVGTVTEEKYGINLVSSPGSIRSESTSPSLLGTRTLSTSGSLESIKIYPFYIIKVKTDDGRNLAVNVLNSPGQPKEALDMLINQGTRVSFPHGNIEQIEPDKYERTFYDSDSEWRKMRAAGYETLEKETIFRANTQIGSKYAHRIKVLDSQDNK